MSAKSKSCDATNIKLKKKNRINKTEISIREDLCGLFQGQHVS